MVRLIRRIIRRMNQILNMYRMVKVVDQVTKEIEAVNNIPVLENDFHAGAPKLLRVKKTFSKRHKKVPFQETHRLLVDTIESEYLEPSAITVGNESFKTVVITKRGRGLIDSVPLLPFIKIGLMKAWLEEYGIVFTSFTALGLGAFGKYLISSLVNIINGA